MGLCPKCKAHLPNFLLNVSTWISHMHFKLSLSKIRLIRFSPKLAPWTSLCSFFFFFCKWHQLSLSCSCQKFRNRPWFFPSPYSPHPLCHKFHQFQPLHRPWMPPFFVHSHGRYTAVDHRYQTSGLESKRKGLPFPPASSKHRDGHHRCGRNVC